MNSNVCDPIKWSDAFAAGTLLAPRSDAMIAAPANVGLDANVKALCFGVDVKVADGFAVTLTETPKTKNAAMALDTITQISGRPEPHYPIRVLSRKR